MTHVGIATQRKQCPGVTCQFQRELEMTDISIDQFPKHTSEIHHNSEKWTSSVNPFPSFTLALFFSHLSHLVIFGQPAHLSLYVSHSPFNGSCISPGVVSTFILASNHVSETQLCLPMDASGDGSKTCQSPW